MWYASKVFQTLVSSREESSFHCSTNQIKITNTWKEPFLGQSSTKERLFLKKEHDVWLPFSLRMSSNNKNTQEVFESSTDFKKVNMVVVKLHPNKLQNTSHRQLQVGRTREKGSLRKAGGGRKMFQLQTKEDHGV